MAIKCLPWKMLWTIFLIANSIHQASCTADAVQGYNDAMPDHFDANFLKTLIGQHVEVDFDATPEKSVPRSSREDKAGGDFRPVTDEELLIMKEMAFQEALALRPKGVQQRGPGQFCDEFITGEEFYIHSPSYPNNYPANTSCKYQIYRRHPEFCGVLLTVLRLDLAKLPLSEISFNNDVDPEVSKGEGQCLGDSLVINGIQHCGRYQRGQTALFEFPSSILTVEFTSGNSHGASGFLLLGRQVKTCRRPKSLGKSLTSAVPCDRLINNDTFALRSPGYPRQYEHNVECHYIVNRKESICGIELTLEDFNLEDGSCMFDYLEVQGRRLCGQIRSGFTRYYEFEGPQMDIRFRSDESTRRGGFSIIGRQVECDSKRPIQLPLSQTTPKETEEITTSVPEDSISFPPPITESPTIFPGNIRPPIIQVAGTLPVSNVSKSDIDRLLMAIGRIPLDFVNLGDNEVEGRGNEGDLMVATETTTSLTNEEEETEEDFTELDPGLLITEEPSTTRTSADQNLPADPDFNPFTGTGLPPTLPNIPGTIPGRIPTTIPGRIPTTVSGRVPTTFPTTVDFPATSSFPTFPTTTFANGEPCDEVFAEESFSISSPNYPNPYSENTDCIYIVGRSSADVCALQLTFVEVDLPDLDVQTGQCTGDFLEIADTRLCGNFQSRVLTFDFPDQTLDMKFHSDSVTSGRGFRIQALQLKDCGPIPPVPGHCDTITQQSSFMLLSPGYPAQYPPNTDCTTTVLRSSTKVINLVLELVDFEMTSTLGCTGDYLEVAGSGQRLCGLLSGQTRTYSFFGNSVIIKFHSGLQPNSGQRFRIRVTQSTSVDPIIPGGCGGIITTATGIIQSPNYPIQYPNNAYCTFTAIKASSDVCQLQLRILDFDVEDSSGCAKDYLQVGYQERLCGRRYPGEIRKYHFANDRLNLFFRTDGYGTGRGFRAEVTQLTCGHFKPMYPSYPSHRPSYRPPHRPAKPWFKPIFNHWWKKNPFSRPHQLWQSYTAESSGTHDHTHTSGHSSGSYGHQNTGYNSASTSHQHHHTTSNPFYPITPIPTTPAPPTSPTPFPTPPPELFLFGPLNDSNSAVRPLVKPGTAQNAGIPATITPLQKTETSNSSEDLAGMCKKVTNQETFQVQSPGYPGPYYTNVKCTFRVERSDKTRCGIELLMDEFDIEKTDGCSSARLTIADRSYCGFIPPGSHSVVPFPSNGEIVMEFVAGEYHSAAGFSMRGRQIGCPKPTSSAPTEASMSRVTFPTSRTKTISRPLALENSEKIVDAPARDLGSIWAREGDVIVPWVGVGGRGQL